MIQKIEKKAKFELLTSTLVLAIFLVLVINTLVFIIYLMKLVDTPDFQSISLSFEEGYFMVNEKKMGISIFFNSIGILFLWFLMTYHTLRSIHRSLSYIL